MDRSRRQEISKNIVEFNSIIILDIIDIYRLLHPTTAEYTFFSSSYRTLTNINHILGHKTHFNKYKGLEKIQCLFSDHSGIKLEGEICISRVMRDFSMSPKQRVHQENKTVGYRFEQFNLQV